MTPEKALENYYYFTGKASDVIRRLGLAAVGVVWVFKKDLQGQPTLPILLFSAAQWAVVSLALDLLQYLYGSAAWGILHGFEERHNRKEFKAPRPINWMTLLLFWSKSFAMLLAYFRLLTYLRQAIAAGGS